MVIARLCRFALFLLFSKNATASAAHKLELAENKSVSESRSMVLVMGASGVQPGFAGAGNVNSALSERGV